MAELEDCLNGVQSADLLLRDHCRLSQPADMTAFAEHLKNHYVPNSVIVDSTASEVPAAHYLEWMQKGLHIITPNKKLNSGPLEQYLALRQFQRESYIHYFYEVGSWIWNLSTVVATGTCAAQVAWWTLFHERKQC